MNIRRSYLAALFAIPLALTACGTDDETPAPTTSSATSTTPSTTTSSTTSSTTSETPAPEPVAEEPAAAEPYVLECLQGAPGPALWSDGTTAYSQACFDEATAGRDYRCPQTDHYVADPSECQSSQPDPATVPIPDGGTCPAYLCGYGSDAEGNRNPSSGEIQGRTLCQDGTIQDPEYCAAIEDVFDANLDYE